MISEDEMNTYGEEVKALIERLPSGSGINGVWEREDEGTDGNEHISNTFSAMDEAGGYCHDYDFHIVVQYVKPGEFELIRLVFPPMKPCCGYGLEYIKEMVLEAMKRKEEPPIKLSMVDPPYILQELETKHHGYDGWETFTIRGKGNVCLAVVGQVDRIYDTRYRATAEFMVNACNQHQELIDALAEAESALFYAKTEGNDQSPHTKRQIEEAHSKVRLVLIKVK
jgi:hypothetical protein